MKEVFSSVLSKSWLLLMVLGAMLFCTRLSLDNLFKAFLIPIVGYNYGFRNINWKGVMSTFLVFPFFSTFRK